MFPLVQSSVPILWSSLDRVLATWGASGAGSLLIEFLSQIPHVLIPHDQTLKAGVFLPLEKAVLIFNEVPWLRDVLDTEL